MIGLLQRVTRASVTVDGHVIGAISTGLLVLIGVERGDDARIAERLLERLLGYRVFADADGRMNASVVDVQGGLLLVPQFTLAADTHKGSRPGFSGAAAPDHARALFLQLIEQARAQYHDVKAGEFGANMQVELCNDGPVTFWLQVPPGSR